MANFAKELSDNVISGGFIEFGEAEGLLSSADLGSLFYQANRIREHFRGKKVHLCSITNAKSGACNQDCKFCAQSISHKTKIPVYPLIEPEEMLSRARIAFQSKTERFCLVTSGGSLTDSDMDKICIGLKLIRQEFPNLKLDASLGALTKQSLDKLKKSGLTRYNHNLETSGDYFSKICTTHSFSDRLATVRLVKEAGLEVCCGGIFGLGESQLERLKFMFTLRELDVDCIPINLLNPIPGTPLENALALTLDEIFKLIAVCRFIHPKKEIKICGGRQAILKDKQSKIFSCGVDSIILGDYLTTPGSPASVDLEMIHSLGLDI